jgi:hypothetical protein
MVLFATDGLQGIQAGLCSESRDSMGTGASEQSGSTHIFPGQKIRCSEIKIWEKHSQRPEADFKVYLLDRPVTEGGLLSPG